MVVKKNQMGRRSVFLYAYVNENIINKRSINYSEPLLVSAGEISHTTMNTAKE
jgi:hypothetical protein